MKVCVIIWKSQGSGGEESFSEMSDALEKGIARAQNNIDNLEIKICDGRLDEGRCKSLIDSANQDASIDAIVIAGEKQIPALRYFAGKLKKPIFTTLGVYVRADCFFGNVYHFWGPVIEDIVPIVAAYMTYLKHKHVGVAYVNDEYGNKAVEMFSRIYLGEGIEKFSYDINQKVDWESFKKFVNEQESLFVLGYGSNFEKLIRTTHEYRPECVIYTDTSGRNVRNCRCIFPGVNLSHIQGVGQDDGFRYEEFMYQMLRFISKHAKSREACKYVDMPFGVCTMSGSGQLQVPFNLYKRIEGDIPSIEHELIGKEKLREEIADLLQDLDLIKSQLGNEILCMESSNIASASVATNKLVSKHFSINNVWLGFCHEGKFYCYDSEKESDIGLRFFKEKISVLFCDRRIKEPIQINLKREDWQGNNVLRLFCINRDGVAYPSSYLFQGILKKGDVKKLVLAHSYEEAVSINSIAIANDKEGECIANDYFEESPVSFNDVDSAAFFYYIPEVNVQSADEHGGFFFYSPSCLTFLDLKIVTNIAMRMLPTIHNWLHLYGLKIANTKSAIGSIMSRNGSHNIGSHVLAALSHNVGTMPDDRVLYQYIQHRMDYIATATTEFPIWKQPILFVGNLMRTFFSQRHLLDYIVGSEGLHGYKFQDKNLTVGDAQKNTVRIHVRKRKDSPGQQNGRYEGKIGDKGFVEFVSYENPECAGRNIPLNEDVELAIPGGIVGQHAFYTIIENVLRNAAKHDWAHFDKRQKAVEKWLDVYIDFWDCAEEGKVEFLIWCEQAILGYGADCANATLLSGKNLEARVKRVSDGDENALRGLSLIQKLQVRVNAPFIDRSGKLRSENWGLAEMRISAGYLQGRDIAEIGGIGKKDGEPDVVSPAIVHVKEDKERERFKGRYCLGYRFYVEKPKELLVIVPAAAEIPKGATVLVQHGIYFDKYSKDLAKKSLPYAYVITSGLNDEEYKTWALPFRTLSNDKYKAECKSAVRKRHVGLENWIPYFDAYDKVLRIANEVTKKGAKNKAQEIMDLVYTAWTKFVIEKRLKDNGKPTPKVLLSILAQENGSHAAGKGLVTTLDLLNMVFEHCFNTSIRAYAKISESLDPEQAEILSLLLNIRKKASLTPQGLQEQNIDVDDSSKIICWQMLKWIESTTEVDSYLAKWERNEVELISAGSAAPKNDSGVMRHFTVADIKQIVLMFKDYLNCRLGNLRPAVAATTVRERRKAREANAHPMSGMASFFAYLRDSALEQARVFLTKYEEDIVTLPKGYDVDDKHSSNVKCDQWYFSGDERGAWDVEVSYCGNTRASDGTAHVQTVEYKRHFDSQKEDKRVGAKNFPNLLYIEALSGTQAYLNSLVQMTRCPKGLLDKRMVSMLLEVGLMRIVIIDERVAKFASDHCDVRVAFENMGIEVKNEESPFVKALISDDGKDISKLKEKREEREILIVHQGIIDKLLKTHDSLSVANLINRIVESGLFRYVVITTGRGTPANLPEQARVLPFSTVEGALFKKYPEKFSLVNAVMNILPVKKEANV